MNLPPEFLERLCASNIRHAGAMEGSRRSSEPVRTIVKLGRQRLPEPRPEDTIGFGLHVYMYAYGQGPFVTLELLHQDVEPQQAYVDGSICTGWDQIFAAIDTKLPPLHGDVP